MNYTLLFFAFLTSVKAFCQNPGEETITIAESERKSASARQFIVVNETDDIDITKTIANWKVNPAVKYIEGHVTHTFTARNEKADIDFDLHDALAVSKVEMDGMDVLFSRGNHKIRIAEPLSSGENHTVKIFYSGNPPSTGFGSFEVSSHNGKPVLWTLSEPFGAYEWWPCRQNLTDKIDTLEIFTEVPLGNAVASNGLLMSKDSSVLGKVIFHWKHQYPIATYLAAIAVTNYVEFSDTVALSTGNLPVLNMVYPESRDNAYLETRNVLRQLVIFDSLFTPYPFMKEKYGHAQFSWGGGMEHQTMSFMGNFHYELQAHELAHQWFGNHVTCGTWNDIWLNEGFATYLTGLCYNIDSPELYWKIWKRNSINRTLNQPSGSVYVENAVDVNRIFDAGLSYTKASMVIHMLRFTMGDGAFFPALKDYLQTYQGFATTDQFQTKMEEYHGKSLNYFFEDWIYGQGFPNFQFNWFKNGQVTTVNSIQTTAHNSVDLFELPLQFRFKDEAHDTVVTAFNDSKTQTFVFDLGFEPDSMIFDPNQWLVAKLVGISEGAGNAGSEALIFPNPSNGDLNITFTNNEELAEVKLFDLRGRELALDQKYASFNLQQFDLRSLADGMYIVEVNYRGTREHYPIIIDK